VAPWKEQLKILCRKPVGEGNSSPIAVGSRVFIHYKVNGKLQEEVACYDSSSGEQLWKKAYDRPALNTAYGNGPRSTPCVSGDLLYTFGITGLLTCFDVSSGKQVWQVDTAEKYKPGKLYFGASCSPLIDGNKLFMNIGGKGTSLIAFNKDDGSEMWRSLDDNPSYSSPILFGEGANRQLVFLTQAGLVSVHPDDGKLHWRSPLRDLLLESSTTPVRVGDTLIGSSITIGTVALELKKDAAGAEQRWKNPELTSYFSTPIALGKHLYLVTGTNPLAALNPLAKKKPGATLHCVDLETGKSLWNRPNVGQYHASLMRTGDDKLLLLEEGGDLVLLKPDAKEYRELCRAHICGSTWAHPCVADGRLFIRDGEHLIAVQLTK
jgi:outer membrane protein assembly factor BamB